MLELAEIEGTTGLRARMVAGDAGAIEVLLTGSVDLGSAGSLDAWLTTAQLTTEHVIVDLERVDFIDSAGLRVLLVAKRAGGTLTLRGVTPHLRLMFDMARLTDVLLAPTP